MKKIAIVLLSILVTSFIIQPDFISDQKRYSRVRTAFEKKGSIILDRLKEAGINLDELNILIVVYKAEELLNIYAKQKTDSVYKKIITYDICASSGQPGPKRKQGDYQVPEGYYFIDRYNPYSNFFLSLGINYPNQSDRKKSNAKHLGGDIFIHGSCVTIGCMPMTDNNIMEIYLYAIYARNSGQLKIPVYIFPFEMTDKNLISYKNKYQNYPSLINFWKKLKIGFDKFNTEKMTLNISSDKYGNYIYQ